MKYLNVAEKNDAAKNIASCLSRGSSTRREGLSKYNKIYEFDGMVRGQNVKMVMTSVSGHLLDYEFTGLFRNWQSCNPIALFDAPIIKSCSENYQNIKKTLEREIRSCQGLIIWTDCDREGENIGFEIINVCTDVKPNITIYRAKFSEITVPSVFRALNNLGQPDRNVSNAVDVRQELDLRTGAAFTRLQTLHLQKAFPQNLSGKLISYGSCQFPTLGFVVDRYIEIENFVPELFWKIKVTHVLDSLEVEFAWARGRVFDKQACEAFLSICLDDRTAKVERVESRQKSKWRPVPLDTVELEKAASRKLKINAKDTMGIAEKLYTQGFISYPRTETNIFPKEINLTDLVQQHCADGRWGAFAQKVLAEGGPNPRQGQKSDQAHPPIHPIKYTDTLTGNEQRMYEYIVRHFLACVSKDALGHETTVTVDIAGETFTAKGLFVLEKNYLEVYVYDKWNAKEIHNYRQGDTFQPTELSLSEGKTSPPKLLTEADLIALMERHGIGTDATHAEHIDKIKTRDYVGLVENTYFIPGKLGMGLIEGYNNIALAISLAKPNLRADFETDLKLICDGAKEPEIVRVAQIAKYKEAFQYVLDHLQNIDQALSHRLSEAAVAAAQNNSNMNIDLKPVLKCPKCGNDMILRTRKTGSGLFLSCVAYPSCRNAVWLPDLVQAVDVLAETCESCGPTVHKLKMKFSRNLFPDCPNPNVLCIGGCNTNTLETLDISIGSVKKINNTPRDNGNQNANGWTRIAANITPPTNSFNTTDYSPGARFEIGNSNRNATRNQDRGRPFLMPPNRPSQAGTQGSSSSFQNNTTRAADESDDVLCNCNLEALQLTVRKDGPNKGRTFYKCPNDVTTGGCNFFQWALDPANTSNRLSTTINNQPELKCKCGQTAAQRTVSKSGPNTGRQFHCCPKPMGTGCDFFKWSDQADAGNASFANRSFDGNASMSTSNMGNLNLSRWGTNTRNNRQKKRTRQTKTSTATTRTTTRAAPKCSLCKQEGHRRNRCPNQD